MSADLASKTLTFLFTDIEGSTRLWEGYRQAMKDALAEHGQVRGGIYAAVDGGEGGAV